MEEFQPLCSDNYYYNPKLRFVLKKAVFDTEEILKLKNHFENSKDIQKHAFARDDDTGKKTRLCIWNHPGNDASGVACRVEKVAGVMQELMGGDEIYHFHSKVGLTIALPFPKKKKYYFGIIFVLKSQCQFDYNHVFLQMVDQKELQLLQEQLKHSSKYLLLGSLFLIPLKNSVAVDDERASNWRGHSLASRLWILVS